MSNVEIPYDDKSSPENLSSPALAPRSGDVQQSSDMHITTDIIPDPPMHDIPMNNIDNLTLELLINKSQYKKYIQKNDLSKYSENQIYLGKIDKYRSKIAYMFSLLLENPEQQVTTDINRDFTYFVKTCIQYFELKEMENMHDNAEDDDDDVMFGSIENTFIPSSSFSYDDNSSPHTPPTLVPRSGGDVLYYGNGAQKCAGTYISKYTMDSFVKRKKT